MESGRESQPRRGARGQGRPVRRERIVPNPKLKLMDQVREVLRLKHYSIRTERCYCDWIRRYIKFHGMRSRAELEGGEANIELFLSDLAVNGRVAASTQNQAFNALLFLYHEVLDQEMGSIQALRAERPERVPTGLTVEEARKVILAMRGTALLVVKLLYGSGLRLLEALRLRVKDLDFEMRQLTVRAGKGDNYAKVVVMDLGQKSPKRQAQGPLALARTGPVLGGAQPVSRDERAKEGLQLVEHGPR